MAVKLRKISRVDAGRIGYLKSKEAMDDCRVRQKKKALEKYHQLKKRCLNCNAILPYEKRMNKFCDLSCSSTYNNKNRIRDVKRWRSCLFCGNLTFNNKFCKIRCQHDYRRSEWKKLVLNVGVFPNLDGNSDCSRAKKLLIELRGHQCEICGIKIWRWLPVPLVFDHIDGDSSNWAISNCRVVCGNCDMQLPTYKSKNKNSSRTKRYASP